MLCLMFKNSKKIEHLDLYRPGMVLRGRHKVKIKLQYSNKGEVLRSPYYLMVNVWNQLDVKLLTIVNIVDFKKEIKLHNLKNLVIGKMFVLRSV